MGMPKPNTKFNFTLATVDQWYEYEKHIGDLVKPYIVSLTLHRITTARS